MVYHILLDDRFLSNVVKVWRRHSLLDSQNVVKVMSGLDFFMNSKYDWLIDIMMPEF